MTKNLQDLRAEARAEMNERFHEVSESDAVWLDTLIDSVLDRAEEEKLEALEELNNEPKLASQQETNKLFGNSMIYTAKVLEVRAKSDVISESLWYVSPSDIEQALLDVRRETIKEGNEELLRAIEMGRVSGNFDVLLYSVTQLYLAREETKDTTTV